MLLTRVSTYSIGPLQLPIVMAAWQPLQGAGQATSPKGETCKTTNTQDRTTTEARMCEGEQREKPKTDGTGHCVEMQGRQTNHKAPPANQRKRSKTRLSEPGVYPTLIRKCL